MPDESCRNCGGELAKYLWCNECRKAIQKICRECSKETTLQIHASCLSFAQGTIQLTKVAVTG